jgi:Ribonuclease HI
MGYKARDFFQLDFESVFGEQWEYHAVNPFRERKQPEGDGQLSLEDLYDPSVLGEESREEYIQRKFSPLRRARICTRTIMAGDMVEIDMYPVFLRKDMSRAEKAKASREAQKNLNNKNRVKNLVRLINANFCKRDYIVHLTYEDGYLPTEERAKKDMQNFLAKVRRRRGKQGLPPLKYIYVTEFVQEGAQTKKVRIHHHLIMSGGLDRDEVEGLWGKGRCRVDRCQPDDFELTGFAKYISKMEQEKGRHSYCTSKNLDKPKVHKSVTKLSRRKFAEIIRMGDGRAELLERLYQGRFKYLDSTTYISREFGGFYLYSRLRRRESVWERKGGGMEERGLGKSAPNAPDSPKKGVGMGQKGKERCMPAEKDFGNVVPCRAFLDFDWKGRLGGGEARCSILLEAVKKGEPRTNQRFVKFSNATKNRAMLKLVMLALSELRPCRLELHTNSKYLTDGIRGRFARQRAEGYRGVRNADLIEEFLRASEPFCITAICEDKNEYTEAMRIQRELHGRDMPIERDNGYGK